MAFSKFQFYILAFHSCIGGCNGCIRIDQDDNNGLENVHKILEKFYLESGLEDEGIARADLWPMAGVLAVNAAIENDKG